jgi:predicted RNase H-like HicB family nuclease
MELHAVIREEEDGSYWAEVKELPGCFASGHDLEEVKDGLVEAITLVLNEEVGAGASVSVRVNELTLTAA